jgi:hypothetical protein
MTAGAIIASLGCYLLIERHGELVTRIYFSQDMPSELSKLAEEIAAHLESGSPCPKAMLDTSACTGA